MSRSGQMRVARTATIPLPNEYILAVHGEYGDWCFDEEAAPKRRGRWREAMGLDHSVPLDLEIGTGNGTHFAHRAFARPERGLLGIELKYKPLIQTIRRARRADSVNARVIRYNAYLADELFAGEEINDVFIFFPDPWERHRQHKHRLIQDEFLARLFAIQRPGSRLHFKTDSRDYFEWSLTRFRRSPYRVSAHTFDLHASELAAGNFVTQFESIFIRQGIQIGYACMER